MVLRIKDPKLYARVHSQLDKYTNQAIKAYSQNKMKEGRAAERKGDMLYKKYYKKMVEVV